MRPTCDRVTHDYASHVYLICLKTANVMICKENVSSLQIFTFQRLFTFLLPQYFITDCPATQAKKIKTDLKSVTILRNFACRLLYVIHLSYIVKVYYVNWSACKHIIFLLKLDLKLFLTRFITTFLNTLFEHFWTFLNIIILTKTRRGQQRSFTLTTTTQKQHSLALCPFFQNTSLIS